MENANWHSVTLLPNDLSAHKDAELLGLFHELFSANATALLHAAMLVRKDSNLTGVHVYYFSPESAIFAHQLIQTFRGGKWGSPDFPLKVAALR